MNKTIDDLEKYCYRYDSSVGKMWLDKERLKELSNLIQKEREEAYYEGYIKGAKESISSVNKGIEKVNNILQKYAEKIATAKAQEIELKLMEYVARNGVIKKLFGRYLFIWCDMKDFQTKGGKE